MNKNLGDRILWEIEQKIKASIQQNQEMLDEPLECVGDTNDTLNTFSFLKNES